MPQLAGEPVCLRRGGLVCPSLLVQPECMCSTLGIVYLADPKVGTARDLAGSRAGAARILAHPG